MPRKKPRIGPIELQDLSMEVLLLILRFLPKSELTRLAFVSKCLREVSEDHSLWQIEGFTHAQIEESGKTPKAFYWHYHNFFNLKGNFKECYVKNKNIIDLSIKHFFKSIECMNADADLNLGFVSGAFCNFIPQLYQTLDGQSRKLFFFTSKDRKDKIRQVYLQYLSRCTQDTAIERIQKCQGIIIFSNDIAEVEGFLKVLEKLREQAGLENIPFIFIVTSNIEICSQVKMLDVPILDCIYEKNGTNLYELDYLPLRLLPYNVSKLISRKLKDIEKMLPLHQEKATLSFSKQ